MTDILEKIGYGRPPKKYQFKKGQSGNPGGRPKKSRSTDDTIIKSLRKRVPARINGKPVNADVLDAIIMAQTEKALKGDTKAAKFLMDMNHQAEQRRYYAETAMDYLNKQITKALHKATYDPKAAQKIFDHVRAFADTVVEKYEEDGGGEYRTEIGALLEAGAAAVNA